MQSDLNKNIQREPTPQIPPRETPRTPTPDTAKDSSVLNWNRLNFIDQQTGFAGGPQKRSGFKLVIWMWASVTVDILILIASSCFFAVSFSMLEKVSAGTLVNQMLIQKNMLATVAVIMALAGWCYFVVMRVFVGSSFGEWSCSLRLGQPFERHKKSYILKVMLRAFLIIATGVVVLPIVSLILRKDIAGKLSGLYIYTLK